MSYLDFSYLSEEISKSVPRQGLRETWPVALKKSNVNLAYVLPLIIQRWPASGMTPEKLEQFLVVYNAAHETQLASKDFLDSFWLRSINGKLLIPESIWAQCYNFKQGRSLDIDAARAPMIAFLAGILGEFVVSGEMCMDKDSLQQLVETVTPGRADETIDLLLEAEILHPEATTGHLGLILHPLPQTLVDSIVASLWEKLVGDDLDLDKFRVFLQTITDFGLWSHNFLSQFSGDEGDHCSRLSIKFLMNEPDLEISHSEYAKAYVDSQYDMHVNLDRVPDVPMSFADAYSVVTSSYRTLPTRAHLSAQQGCRSIYSMALHLLLQCDKGAGGWYQQVIRLFQDTRRPYMAISLYDSVRHSFPEVIPYLLGDPNVLPIAFMLLDEISYDEKVLAPSLTREERTDRVLQWRSDLRRKMIELSFQQLAKWPTPEKLRALALWRIFETVLTSMTYRNLDSAHNISTHLRYKKDYDWMIHTLESRRATLNEYSGYYSHLLLTTPMIDTFKELAIEASAAAATSNQVTLSDWYFILLTDLLKILQGRVQSGLLDTESLAEIKAVRASVLDFLAGELTAYFRKEEVMVVRTPGTPSEPMAAERGTGSMMVHLLDWGFLLLNLFPDGKLSALHGTVEAAVMRFENRSAVNNTREFYEISFPLKIYMRIVLRAYVQIQEEKEVLRLSRFPVKEAISLLETTIKVYAPRFNKYDEATRRIDVFGDKMNFRLNFLYTETLTHLLFRCINQSEGVLGEGFVNAFLAVSTKLEQILMAINVLNKPSLKNIAVARLDAIDLDAVVQGTFIDDLYSASLNAVNSRDHWQSFGQRLLTKLKDTLKSNRFLHRNYTLSIFELELLLALKAKDLAALQALWLPVTPALTSTEREEGFRKKNFYHALLLLYHEHRYDESIRMLTDLKASQPANPDFAVQLFRAKTLKTINSDSLEAPDMLIQAYLEWEDYFSDIKNEEKEDFQHLRDLISFNKIHYLSLVGEFDSLEVIIKTLPESFRYDDEIIKPVCHAYQVRELALPALDYVQDCISYYERNKVEVPSIAYEIKDAISNEKVIDQLKALFIHLPTRRPKDIPRILPAALNGCLPLEEFVNMELIQAAKIMLEKIQGIRQVDQENRFSDLMMAALRLRLPIWGWSITDQSRMGTSPGGADAGEVDITLSAGGQSFAIVEALVYRSNDYLRAHIFKPVVYNANVENYYIVCYVLSNMGELEDKWADYQSVVQEFDFGATWGIGKKGEALIHIKEYDTNSIRCAKMKVGEKVNFYHIMVRIPPATVAVKKKNSKAKRVTTS